jgi:hypothetical protein
MGQFQLLQDTRATLKGNVGPNAHMQGKSGQDQSGRAIMALQQAGMTEMTPLLDNLRHFTLRMYRQIWNRIRQFWDGERWIRVTDDENNVRFVGLNVTQGQLALQKIGEAVKSGEIDQQTAQQYAQQIQMHPQSMQPANRVAELDVDIDIDEVNETPTLQIEQFEQLATMASNGVFGQPVPAEVRKLLIQASNLRDKQKLIEILEQGEKQQPNPMQEIAVAGEKAKVEETQSKTMLNVAKAHHTAAQPMIDAFSAGAQQPGVPM